MKKIMNDNDSKAFLKEMARLCPDYKENFGAVSNLIVLLMEELQKERKGRKRGEKFEKMWNKMKRYYIKDDKTFRLYNEWGYFCEVEEMIKDMEQEYFPKEI